MRPRCLYFQKMNLSPLKLNVKVFFFFLIALFLMPILIAMNHEKSQYLLFFALVFPGAPEIVSIKPVLLGKQLIPGQVIRDLKLEVHRLFFSS